MKRSSAIVLVFAVAFAVFFILPPFLGAEFGPYPLMKVSDVFDLLTPLALLPLYWVLYRAGQKEPINLSGIIIFFVFAASWAAGQGMHLSANSISHLLKGMESSDIYKLTHFYDEVLSHYLWHTGIVGLSACIIYRQRRNPFSENNGWLWPVLLAGIIHGFTFFLIVIEAGTAPLGITFAVLAALFVLVRGHKKLGQQPVLMFFLISYIVAVLFFLGWGIYWQGLPQFSEVGII
jgi:hypothetical protein